MTPEPLPGKFASALKQRFEASPFNRKLGVRGECFEVGRAVLRLDFATENTTVADIVHGGAIAALVDCAATAAAWTTVDDPPSHRGITVDLALNFIASGRSAALLADARVIRRGRSITYLECTVTNEEGEVVSKALVTYKLSRIAPSHDHRDPGSS